MDKVGIVDFGAVSGMKPKHVIVGNNITPEQHAEVAKQVGCELEEIVVMSVGEYMEYCSTTNPTIFNESIDEVHTLVNRTQQEYIPIKSKKERETPWYVQAGSKNKRKRW